MQQFVMPEGQTIQGLLRSRPIQQDYAHGVEQQDTLYIWTHDTVYECSTGMSPEQLFIQLVVSGLERNHAEPLGQTLELDVYSLYKKVGEKHFNDGQYSR